ncbi:hypothetical protein ABBQ38_007209 [Trebouxia sp. C0009 RCD-2024]
MNWVGGEALARPLVSGSSRLSQPWRNWHNRAGSTKRETSRLRKRRLPRTKGSYPSAKPVFRSLKSFQSVLSRSGTYDALALQSLS